MSADEAWRSEDVVDDDGADDVDDDDDVGGDDVIEPDGGGAEAPLMHDGMPITGYFQGEPIPDLNALSQDRWLEVLRPLSHWPRVHATAALRTAEQVHAAWEIKGRLLLEDGPAPRQRPIEAASRAIPRGAPPARGAGRQINFRLGPQEHARLVEAAGLFAMTPTALARILTVRGVDRALHEERGRR